MALAARPSATPYPQTSSPGDPTTGEVQLRSAPDWRASLVHDGDAGVWTVRSVKLLERLGCDEVIGLDDKGRCTVLVSYSGKWTPLPTLEDGQWLGAIAHADLDAGCEGAELYVGGKSGRLLRIHPRREGGFDTKLVAYVAGEELHTFLAGDLIPTSPGNEMLVFTGSGRVFLLRSTLACAEPTPLLPPPAPLVPLAVLPGRVRDALLLPREGDEPPTIACASRAGEIAFLTLSEQGMERQVVVREPMGFGRLAMRPRVEGKSLVLYAARDDGLLLRLERDHDGAWLRDPIYAGPQGLRGVVAGRFDCDPHTETVAVFGYSGKVQLLTQNGAEPWRVETLFEDEDKGHWLEVAELDGRNGTDEILCSGYSGRIALLARPPGYGLLDVATDPDPAREIERASGTTKRPVRVAVRAGRAAAEQLSSLHYRGGFEPKTLVYETLFRLDDRGVPEPLFAAGCRIEEGGRQYVFDLRPNDRFHDGAPVTAEAVREHFARWVGLPEHAWLGANQRIQRVEARSPSELAITLDRPYPLLFDLCAINPCAVRGPGTLDREGNFVRPVGTGPFRFVETREGGKVLRFARASAAGSSAEACVDLVRFEADSTVKPFEALLRGDVDVVVDGWNEKIPRDRVLGLGQDPEFRLVETQGSSVVYLSFRLESGPTADVAVRRAVAAALQRDELIRRAERGCADACTTWAAPGTTLWSTRRAADRAPTAMPGVAAPLRVLGSALDGDERELAWSVAEQLTRAGIPAEVDVLTEAERESALKQGAWDLRIERTWGRPYDPYLSLVARFAPPPPLPLGANAAAAPAYVDPRLRELVERAAQAVAIEDLQRAFVLVQERMDQEALIVPLYVPRRFAVLRRGCGEIGIDRDLYRFDLTRLAESVDRTRDG